MSTLRSISEENPGQTRVNLKIIFASLYHELRAYYGNEDELQLINSVGAAAGGDFHGTAGLQKQLEWMKTDLEELQKAEAL